ncbi:MAG: glycosyltransferase family 4 protein [Planctomycetes bacterium]|nr:glycosyltransferase family 4 protein [Planctomycetota bacterium]
MPRTNKLLTVGHSYVVALNRRLAHEMAVVGQGRWEVTVAAPDFVHGDLRPIRCEPSTGEACRTLTFPLRFSQRPHVSSYSRRLRELVRADWDHVHIWQEPYTFSGFQLSRWIRRETPMTFWTAQNINKYYPPPFGWFERYCYRRCIGWLACGATTAEVSVARGFGGKPHEVIPLGVDLDVFRPNVELRKATFRTLNWDEGGPPVVGYLGRFIPAKGIELLCGALDAIESPWRALFVGGGTLEKYLRTWARRYSDDRVRVVTNVPHDDVPVYLNSMNILAAPSQSTPRWREQLGRMLIEAMACGVPVVGSDSGEIPFVIGDSGRVLPERDLHGWSESLAALLESPSQRELLAAQGLEHVRCEYAWPVIARRHLGFFERLRDARHGNLV